MEKIKLIFEKIDCRAILPKIACDGDAGIDVFACLLDSECKATESILISPGKTIAINTGLRCAIPEGWFLDVRPRSGISLKTALRVANAPGTIDENYKGEILIILTNTSQQIDGVFYTDYFRSSLKNPAPDGIPTTITINTGDKIAQLVLQRRYPVNIVEGKVDGVGGDRGGGFGHTGTDATITEVSEPDKSEASNTIEADNKAELPVVGTQITMDELLNSSKEYNTIPAAIMH